MACAVGHIGSPPEKVGDDQRRGEVRNEGGGSQEDQQQLSNT